MLIRSYFESFHDALTNPEFFCAVISKALSLTSTRRETSLNEDKLLLRPPTEHRLEESGPAILAPRHLSVLALNLNKFRQREYLLYVVCYFIHSYLNVGPPIVFPTKKKLSTSI